MMKRFSSMVLLLLVCITPISALCRTWHVEKDGSGDYSVIQDCVNAASSGDTIIMGPGRYDDWQLYGSAHPYPARVIIDDIDLTIIGNDEGGTIIGPQDMLDGEHHGVALLTGSAVVQSIQFENLAGGVMSWSGGNMDVENCTFNECDIGTLLWGGEGQVSGCEFSLGTTTGHQVVSYYQTIFLIRDCDIEKSEGYGDPGHGINVVSCQNAVMERCRVSGMRTGVQFEIGTSVTMLGCQLWDISRSAVFVGLGSNAIQINNCSILDSDIGIKAEYPGFSLRVESTVFGDIGTASLAGNYFDDGYFRNNILSSGSKGVVACGPHLYEEKTVRSKTVTDFDMRNNYWGTDNPDSIQAWIEDFEDDPSIDYRILWSPFSGEPVATKTESLGGVKSLYR